RGQELFAYISEEVFEARSAAEEHDIESFLGFFPHHVVMVHFARNEQRYHGRRLVIVLEKQGRSGRIANFPAGIAEKRVKKRGFHRGIAANVAVPAVPELAGCFNAIATAVALKLPDVRVGALRLAWPLEMVPLAGGTVRATRRRRTNAMDAFVAADK